MLISTGQAASLLGLGRAAVVKLLATGLLIDQSAAGTRFAKIDLDAVQELAAFPTPEVSPDDGPVVAVHISAEAIAAEGRTTGWSASAAAETPDHAARRWVGAWPISADGAASLIGGLVVPDVAGIVVAPPRRILAVRRDGDRVSFDTSAVANRAARRYTGHRFQSRAGNLLQRLDQEWGSS